MKPLCLSFLLCAAFASDAAVAQDMDATIGLLLAKLGELGIAKRGYRFV